MIDVREPVTNPELKAALEQMHRENTRENQDRALDALLQAHLLSPVTIDPTPEGSETKEKRRGSPEWLVSLSFLLF